MTPLILPLSPYSQFPYPLRKEAVFPRCWMRCGKLNVQKQRFLVVYRNCLYYYKTAAVSVDESTLATGVLPLSNLLFITRMVVFMHGVLMQVTSEICEVLITCPSGDVPYIRILEKDHVTARSKPRFSFEFGTSVEERRYVESESEALRLVACLKEHSTEVHPCDPIMEFSIQVASFVR